MTRCTHRIEQTQANYKLLRRHPTFMTHMSHDINLYHQRSTITCHNVTVPSHCHIKPVETQCRLSTRRFSANGANSVCPVRPVVPTHRSNRNNNKSFQSFQLPIDQVKRSTNKQVGRYKRTHPPSLRPRAKTKQSKACDSLLLQLSCLTLSGN